MRGPHQLVTAAPQGEETQHPEEEGTSLLHTGGGGRTRIRTQDSCLQTVCSLLLLTASNRQGRRAAQHGAGRSGSVPVHFFTDFFSYGKGFAALDEKAR